MNHVGTASFWIDTAPLPEFHQPNRDVDVDVIVVGGGITGITAAFLLKRAGKTVALLERERCATIDSGHTTAHVTCVTDTGLQDLIKTFGKNQALAVWDAGAAAIDQIVSNIRSEAIDCDFQWVPGYLHVPLRGHEKSDIEELGSQAQAAAELGIRAELVTSVPFFDLPGLRFPHQALFHPRKYLASLVRLIPGNGSHVFEHAPAEHKQDDPFSYQVGDHRVTGRYLVLATHSPLAGSNGFLDTTLLQSKLAWYTTYAIGAKVPTGLIPAGLYWDLDDPYYYLRVNRYQDYDYAIFGGEDHKTGQSDDTSEPFRRLEELFREFLPDVQVDHRWSGQVIETNDGLPFIGPIAENQFVSTGYAGNGMTFGTLGGMMAADAVLGRPNPWQDLFDVHRKKIFGGTLSYLAENKDYPFYMLRDRLARAEGSSLSDVGPGEGKILSIEGKRVAAYRSKDGHVTLCSPVCTHLGCIVGWNGVEETWDCPCHGSRFKPTGEVLAGPAEEPLEKLPSPADA